ncbi:MAG: hypothetical protein U1A78_38845 [Polyangia bacterium]
MRKGLSLRGLLAVSVLATAPSLTGCALVNQVLSGQGGAAARAVLPNVQAGQPSLVRSPSLQSLAAYYCPTVVQDQIVRLGCTVALGPQPARDLLVFEFGVPITIANPNNVPIPALDVLLGLKLFPGQNSEGLGSVCVSLCGANAASCTGTPQPGACQATNGGIKNLSDFVSAIPGLIAGLASGSIQNELRKSMIPAGGDVRLNLTFPLGIDQALRLIQNVAAPLVTQLAKRQGGGGLDIPVAAEGTVYVNMPVVGKQGIPFGPMQSNWRVL